MDGVLLEGFDDDDDDADWIEFEFLFTEEEWYVSLYAFNRSWTPDDVRREELLEGIFFFCF